MAYTNHAGKKFNLWTVLERVSGKRSDWRAAWMCQCQCGTIRFKTTWAVSSGDSKSCWCLRKKLVREKANLKNDISGQTFNYLTVIKRSKREGYGITFWECKCKCGNSGVYRASALKNGSTKSCGCKYFETFSNKIPKTTYMEGQILSCYRVSCRKKGKEFSLSREQFLLLIRQDCHYCGTPPSNVWRSRRNKLTLKIDLKYNGIDRVDNSRGYEIDNVVPCCRECNTIKHDSLSYDEMKAVAQFLKKYRSKQRALVQVPQPEARTDYLFG